MPSQQFEQFDFSVGSISPDHVTYAGLAIRARSLRTARNVRLMTGGPVEARPGTERLAMIDGNGIVVDVTIAGSVYMLVFTATKVAIWNKATRSLITTLTGQPWSDPIIDKIQVSPHGSKTFVFYNIFQPVVIERSVSGSWSATTFAFSTGIGAAKTQPYYRFAAPGVTLTPSATTGAITLTASAAYFQGGHVGLRLRLQGRELTITGYTDSTHVSANVVQTLFPTVTIPVTSSVGFEIGEIITGKDSTAKGEVTAIPDGTHITVLAQSFTAFYWSGSTGEKVIGANAVTDTTGAQTTAANAAVLDWTEQAMSDLRGWPGSGIVHRGRLWMANFENIPFGIAASAINDFYDFEVGTNDADAIFEELGDEGTGLVRHLVSAEQLLVLTSKRVFYYPESEANPIRPSSFQLLQIGPDGASACRPALISEGILFGEAGEGAILGAFPTGDVRRSWRTADMSRLAPHLINSPRCLAYVSGPQDADAVGNDRRVQRFVYAPNEAGDMAVISYSESEGDAVPGWVNWDTTGIIRWAAANQGECWAIVARVYNNLVNYQLEVFDTARLIDGAVDVGPGDYVGVASGQTIETPDGTLAADLVYAASEYPNATLSLVIGGSYVGVVTTNGSGQFGVPDIAGDIEVGFGFEVECVPWHPLPPEDQRARRRKRRISGALVRYQGKGIAVNGQLRPLYDSTDDPTVAAPSRDEWWRWTTYGWSHEPTFTVSRPFASPWRMLGISMEVAG